MLTKVNIQLANLFAQGRIDRRRLLGESQSFLNDELMTAWKRVLGWSEVRPSPIVTGIIFMYLPQADDLRAQIAARTQDGGAGAGAPAFDSREGLDLPVDPEDDGIRIGSYRRVPRVSESTPPSALRVQNGLQKKWTTRRWNGDESARNGSECP